MSNSNKDLPKLLQNRIDNKGLTAGIVYDLVDIFNKKQTSANTKVFFYTAFGIVTGNWVISDETEDETVNLQAKLHKTIIKQKHDQIRKEEAENEHLRLINDSGTIPLVNATIRPYAGGEHHLSDFLLFTDQIIGLSYGEEKQPE